MTDLTPAAQARRSKRYPGPIVLMQTDTDPGDMGEPREVWDDTEHVGVVFVPSFELWGQAEARATAEAENERLRVVLVLLMEPDPDIGPSGEFIDSPKVEAWIRRQRKARKEASRLLAATPAEPVE